jgi:ABC-type glycerol-3-phosphate transport system substrate-binding protein
VFTCCTKQVEDQTSEKASIDTTAKSQLRIMGHWFNEGKKESLIRESVREFSYLHQDYDIKLEFPHHIFKGVEESQLYFAEYDTIAKMVKSNIWPWDVLFCDQERYKKVGELVGDPAWGKTYLVDFSEQQWFNDAHKPGLIETMNLKEIYGGIIPGPIFEGITNILFVSEEVEQKLGIKVRELDMTSDDFLQYAQAVAKYNESHSDKITFFSHQLVNAPEYLFSQLALSVYGKTQPGEREKGIEALQKAYSYLEELSKYKALDQYIDNTGMQYDKAQRILYHDKCLFNMQPSWMYLLWNNSNPEGLKKMRPCEIPSMTGGESMFYAGFFQVVFVVPKNAKNREGAEQYIKFLSSSEIAEKWINYSKCPTGLRNNISYTDFGQDKFDIFFRHLNQKFGNRQAEVNLSRYLLKSEKTINFFVPEVMKGEINASEAIRRVLKQI